MHSLRCCNHQGIFQIRILNQKSCKPESIGLHVVPGDACGAAPGTILSELGFGLPNKTWKQRAKMPALVAQWFETWKISIDSERMVAWENLDCCKYNGTCVISRNSRHLLELLRTLNPAWAADWHTQLKRTRLKTKDCSEIPLKTLLFFLLCLMVRIYLRIYILQQGAPLCFLREQFSKSWLRERRLC